MSTNRGMSEDEEMDAIEGRLAGTLRRVTPPREFVQRLRGRIHLPERSAIAVRIEAWERLMFVFGSVLSGAVVVLTVARAMYHLFGRRNG